jgi:chemotaxis protein CheD
MTLPKQENYYLEPGFIYFSKKPVMVKTVLGSCVSVCVWDPHLKYGGMNHYLYPVVEDASKAIPRFGNVATLALIRMMLEAGCQPQDLQAQIFGGGYMQDGDRETGPQNVEVARRMLKRHSIEIVSEDVGGGLGRKIVFDTGTGQVAVLKVQQIRQSDWH